MLTSKDIDFYNESGYLILKNFISEENCSQLKARAEELTNQHSIQQDKTIFDGSKDNHTSNQYFLDSAERCSLFYEKDTSRGEVVNKIGHALHEEDPVFSSFSRQRKIEEVVDTLGVPKALLIQSMFIFKHAYQGGEVSLHQDESFLKTTPETLMGLWFALDDATIENGCLWALPGGHCSPVHTYFKRMGDTVEFEKQYEPTWEQSELIPLEVPRGSLVVLHGRLPHKSEANRSAHSRAAYTLHVMNADSHYASTNWLQREKKLRGF
jgi:phytanoyl-CoA hydroxylase